MAYPGTLHALVARDRHMRCNSIGDLLVTTGNGVGSALDEKLNSDQRRSRAQSKQPDRYEREYTVPDVYRAIPVGLTAGQRRPPLFHSIPSTLGTKAWRMSPSDCGRMMDHGIFGVPDSRMNADRRKIMAMRDVGCMNGRGECYTRNKARARENELRMAKTLCGKAFSLRKSHLRNSAHQLIEHTARVHGSEAGNNNSRATTSPKGVEWLKPFATGQAEHLGIPVMPRNPFREEMAPRGRKKEARCSKTTSSSGVVSDSRGISARKKVGDLVGARVVAKKSCRLRYATRWHEIAMLHRLLESGCNRRPVRGTFDLIVRALRETACENPSPGCLSRRQFVSTLSSTLDPCDTPTLHRIYSSFDPDGTDKIRSVDFLACVLVTHKPETEAFLEGLQQTFIGNMGAISSELHAELTKGNRQVCWRFLRRLFRLFQARSSMNIPRIERLFQLCATSDEEFLQMSETFKEFLQNFIPAACEREVIGEHEFDRMFCTAFELLDLFNTNMTTVQVWPRKAKQECGEGVILGRSLLPSFKT